MNLGPSGAMREFGESAATRAMQPVNAMPPIPGGIVVAMVNTQQPVFGPKGKLSLLLVRSRLAFPEAKVVARCLLMRTGPEIHPCPHHEAAFAGRDGFDALRALHPEEHKLRERHEQHVFCLYSADLVDPEGYVRAKTEHDERAKAYEQMKSWMERQAMLATWSQQKVSDPRYPFPAPEIIGYLSEATIGEE